MEISRARFLVLASMLATTACSSDEKKDGEDAGTGGHSTGGKSGGSGGSSSGGATVDAGSGGADGGVPDGGGADGSTPDASTEGGAPEGGTTDGGDGGGSKCDDTLGTPGDCSLLAPDESCAPFDWLTDTCQTADTYMKPRVAEKFVACVLAESPTQQCDASNTYDCKKAVLKNACPDPVVDDWCNDIVAACPQTDIAECRMYLNGLTAVGKDGILSCMESSCYDIYSCVESL